MNSNVFFLMAEQYSIVILKLKKVGKPARPFRYDLNQIPYDDTAEVSNRFKGLDLIDRVPDESQGRGSLVGCRLWGRTESDTTEAT